MTLCRGYTLNYKLLIQKGRGVKMRKIIYGVTILMFALGIFAAIYFRQPTGFALAAAAAFAFAYFFIRGKK